LRGIERIAGDRMLDASGTADPTGATGSTATRHAVDAVDAVDAPPSSGDPGDRADPGEHGGTAGPTGGGRALRCALALAIAPFAVSAIVTVVFVGGDYLPAGDLAMTELHIRDIGRHEVLTGLHSRPWWNHPGPLQFYLVAPFYWLTGGSSIGTVLGALTINAASVAGILAVARRRGGTPLMIASLVACLLLVRSLGPEAWGDDWNLRLTTLPYAVLAFLVWSMVAGEWWALPVAALVTSLLVQTHIGFVVLALPLFLAGAAALGWRAWRGRQDAPRSNGPSRRASRSHGRSGRAPRSHGPSGRAPRSNGPSGRASRRRVLGSAAAAAAVLAVAWLPPALDIVLHAPDNRDRILDYFDSPLQSSHGFAEGWRVTTGQFGYRSEWFTGKLPAGVQGQSPYLLSSPLPVLLLALAAASAVVVRRTRDGWGLVAVTGATVVLGIVSVMRTIGAIADYRLLYTWVPPALATTVVLWGVWVAAARRWPRAERAITAVGWVAAATLAAVTVVSAARAGVPHEDQTEVVAHISGPVIAEYADAEAPVVVRELANLAGPWYSRALVLQLERHGIDVRVPADMAGFFTNSRVRSGGPVADHLVVATGDDVERLLDDPDSRMLVRWTAEPPAISAGSAREQARLTARFEAGEMTAEEYVTRLSRVLDDAAPAPETGADDVAVFVDERPEPGGPWNLADDPG
jgi:hypothetical protein